MANKDSRNGGKFSGKHSTLIPVARMVADIADNCPVVTKICLGFIKAGLRSTNGQRRLKITDKGTCLLLAVRDNNSHQEIHVYAEDNVTAKKEISEKASKKGLIVTLQSHT